MIGSIIGDIVGSIYEFHNIKTKKFSLFSDRSSYTDDSILTIATAKWILEGASKSDSGMYYYRYGANYPHPFGGYGSGFQKWLWQAEDGNFEPYTSCGNGSAMRIGPVGWAFDTIEDILAYAKYSAECTHNHPEGIKGAQATALCMLLSRKGLGTDNSSRISASTLACFLQQYGVRLNVVAFASDKDSVFYKEKYFDGKSPYYTKIKNEQRFDDLKSIAKKTDGVFVQVRNKSQLKEAYKCIQNTLTFSKTPLLNTFVEFSFDEVMVNRLFQEIYKDSQLPL